MSPQLRTFIDWLESDLTHFVAIVEEGSAVSGDPYQTGFSDHDLNIIVRHDMQSEMKAIYTFLEANPLGNEYLVGLRIADDFAIGDSLNDLSLKFRAKTLAGKDVVATKTEPSKEVALHIGTTGLVQLVKRLERRWLNLAQWTNEYAQKKNYEIFKYFFVFAAAVQYGRTGYYPKKRSDVVHLLHKQAEATKLLTVTNDITHATKTTQKDAIEAAIVLIKDIAKE